MSLPTSMALRISIHALREEGDKGAHALLFLSRNFNPRPPRGGRLTGIMQHKHGARYFNPRPPRGGRPRAVCRTRKEGLFQSTPSARRATVQRFRCFCSRLFQSTPSARRATCERAALPNPLRFQSTPSARRATIPRRWTVPRQHISIHALREEGDRGSADLD